MPAAASVLIPPPPEGESVTVVAGGCTVPGPPVLIDGDDVTEAN